MLLDKEVNISPRYMVEYYENLGYKMPYEYKQLYCNNGTKKNGKKKYIPKDATIKVKVSDLMPNSKVKVRCKCDNCGKEYALTYGKYNHQTSIHDGKLYCEDCCNTICFSGENNNSWNPNLSEEDRRTRNEGFRHIDGYKDFIKQILYLYNYTCFLCGSKENLEAHHLDGYEWCKEKRTDVSNGVCLCKKCHRAFHSKYGYKGNTKQQFEEFIGKPIETFTESDRVKFESASKVICLETNEIFNSAYECDVLMFHNTKNGRGTRIRSCCDRKGTTKGYHFMWYSDYKKLSDDDIKTILNKKPYAQPNIRRQVVCEDLKFIFSSVLACNEYMHISNSHFRKYLQHKTSNELYRGHKYCYVEEYNRDVNELEKVGDGW